MVLDGQIQAGARNGLILAYEVTDGVVELFFGMDPKRDAEIASSELRRVGHVDPTASPVKRSAGGGEFDGMHFPVPIVAGNISRIFGQWPVADQLRLRARRRRKQ